MNHSSNQALGAASLARGGDTRIKGGKRATRLAFFIAGFALACWAPLVPFAQARLQADAAMLGNILLCLGCGAVLGMPLASMLSGRIGSKAVIIAGGIGLMLTLPLLGVLAAPISLGICLVLFGASVGAIDVATNIHGIEVQNLAGTPLMSGFHGMYSLGGLVGASGMAALLSFGLAVSTAALLAAVMVLGCVLSAISGLLATRSTEKYPLLVIPRGCVMTLGVLLFVIFLAEGAMLDWSAILLTQHKQVAVSQAGFGYAAFAIAMALSRLVGDRLVARHGERATLIAGFIVTAAGIALAAWSSRYAWVMVGMIVGGFAAGNIVPALFNLVGRQRVMPVPQAVAAASMMGYLGVLVGPALIGHAAHFVGLVLAFHAVAALVVLMTMWVPGVSRRCR